MREKEVSTGDAGCLIVCVVIAALLLTVACICETWERAAKHRAACPCQQQTEEP
jgi:hypothetical protein